MKILFPIDYRPNLFIRNDCNRERRKSNHPENVTSGNMVQRRKILFTPLAALFVLHSENGTGNAPPLVANFVLLDIVSAVQQPRIGLVILCNEHGTANFAKCRYIAAYDLLRVEFLFACIIWDALQNVLCSAKYCTEAHVLYIVSR